MSWIRKVADAIAPGWIARRDVARLRGELARQQWDHLVRLSTYEAAARSRETGDWNPRTVSADQAIIPDAPTLNARARQAARDDWAAASIIRGDVRHIVGKGITALANARDISTGLPLTHFNNTINRLWRRWTTNPKWCDIERRKTFLAMQHLMIREYKTVGEGFAILNYTPRPDMVGLTIQIIEIEQLACDLSRNPETGYEIRHGIELDPHGAAAAYWIYTQGHPLDTYAGKPERIDADRVLHHMRQDRPRQSHGVTHLAPVLKKLRNLLMYDEYTVLRARAEACTGASIETDLGAGPASVLGLQPGDGESATDERGNQEFVFEPGMVWDLGPGKRAQFHAPQTPGGNYEPFTLRQLKDAAAGAGSDYPTVSRDYSGNTYSGQRQGLLEMWMETDPEQDFLTSNFCQPVHDSFVTFAALEGRVSAPGWWNLDQRAALLDADWQPQAKDWIDPANRAKAEETKLKLRVTTRRKIANELGETVEENFQQLEDENDMATRHNIALPENGGTTQ